MNKDVSLNTNQHIVVICFVFGFDSGNVIKIMFVKNPLNRQFFNVYNFFCRCLYFFVSLSADYEKTFNGQKC